jgi:uncharacterized membrane protein
LGDHDVFGIAAVVVKATFGRGARPRAVEPVELEAGQVVADGATVGGRVVVRVATMWTHFFTQQKKKHGEKKNRIDFW